MIELLDTSYMDLRAWLMNTRGGKTAAKFFC